MELPGEVGEVTASMPVAVVEVAGSTGVVGIIGPHNWQGGNTAFAWH